MAPPESSVNWILRCPDNSFADVFVFGENAFWAAQFLAAIP